ncbi:MAG: hypothetical protein C4K60_18530 [Ideonella sp. MAG2]|nr:MAG: hypothetical protein C4K60_18530 [Ideonella sp. MAG2]
MTKTMTFKPLLLLVLMLVGCNPQAAQQRAAEAASAASAVESAQLAAKNDPFRVLERNKSGAPLMYSVVPYGYNYTDGYIDSFSVNGAGGGNLAVSTPTSPGGGHTCCTMLFSGTPKGEPFKIKWTRDRETWCELEVHLQDPVPAGVVLPSPQLHWAVQCHRKVASRPCGSASSLMARATT